MILLNVHDFFDEFQTTSKLISRTTSIIINILLENVDLRCGRNSSTEYLGIKILNHKKGTSAFVYFLLVQISVK